MNITNFTEQLQDWLTTLHLDYEVCTPLGRAVHDQLLIPMFTHMFRVRFDPAIHTASSTFYTSRLQCEAECRKCLDNAYTKAADFLSANDNCSMAKATANHYAEHIQSVLIPVIDNLKMISDTQCMTSAFDFLITLIYNSPQNLLTQFKKELTEHSDFYSLPPFADFENRIDIEDLDFRVATNGFARLAERFLTNNVQYHIKNMYDLINEMESELNDNSDSFFHTAYNLYIDYIRRIAQVLDMIGEKLPELQPNESYPQYLARCCMAS